MEEGLYIVMKVLPNNENDWMKAISPWPPGYQRVPKGPFIIRIVHTKQRHMITVKVSGTSQIRTMLNVLSVAVHDIVTRTPNVINQLMNFRHSFGRCFKMSRSAKDLICRYHDRSLATFRTKETSCMLSVHVAQKRCTVMEEEIVRIILMILNILFHDKDVFGKLSKPAEPNAGVFIPGTRSYDFVGMFPSTPRHRVLLPSLYQMHTDQDSVKRHIVERSHSTGQEQKVLFPTQRRIHFDTNSSIIKLILSNCSVDKSVDSELFQYLPEHHLLDNSYHIGFNLTGAFTAAEKDVVRENVFCGTYFPIGHSRVLVSDYAEKEKMRRKGSRKRESTSYQIGWTQSDVILEPINMTPWYLIVKDVEDSHAYAIEEPCKVLQNAEKPGSYSKYKSSENSDIHFDFDHWDVCSSSKLENASSVFDRKEMLRFLRHAGYQVQDVNETSTDREKRECENIKETSSKTFTDILHQTGWKPVFQESIVAPLVSLRHYFDKIARGKTHSLQDEMTHEGFRLKSFHNVKVDTSCIRLAAAGFYATGDGDETRCFSCGILHRRWRRGDIPFQVHCKISPDCQYVSGSDTSNVPIDPTTPPSVQSANLMNGDAVESSDRFLNENTFTETQGATSNYNANNTVASGRSYQTDVNARARSTVITNTISNLSFSNAVYPNYSDIKPRIASFLTWPQGHCKKPADLVPVGFFYAGYGDCVRCFCCGIGLRTWEAEDDPWEEHVRWRSSCDYVKAVKGEEFIAQALAGLARSSQQIDLTTISGAANTGGGQERYDASNILSRDVCKQALEMGFSADIVRQHAGDMVQSQGTLRLDVLIEKILNDERNQEEINQEANRRHTEKSPRRTPGDQQGPTTSSALKCDSSGSSKPHSGRFNLMASDSVEQYTADNLLSSELDEPQARLIQDEGYVTSYGTGDEPADALGSLDSADVPSRNNNSGSRQDMFHSMLITSGQKRGKDTGVMLTTISEENREMRESGLCKICLDDPANIVFLPCGHLVACATCTPALERCPVCRTFIRGSVRVHLTGMDSISHHALQE